MSILAEIIIQKNTEVDQLTITNPLLKEQFLPKKPNFLNFLNFTLIAEIKPKSPSSGQIRANFNPILLTQEFKNQGASAISILTDQKYFGGNLEMFKEARKNTTLPLLRKDFIISIYQVLETVQAQADIILLIVKILEKDKFAELLELSLNLNLQVLVEIFNQKELNLALEVIEKVAEKTKILPEQIIFGVNNRNLETFETSLDICLNLSQFIPQNFAKIALSGIKNQEDLEIIKKAGYNGVLIGEGLAKNPELFNFFSPKKLTENVPILVLGTTETYQTEIQGKNSSIMIGGNAFLVALAVSKSQKCVLVSGVGDDIFTQISNLPLPNLNRNFLNVYSKQKSFFYKSILDKNGVETSGIPEFNCHKDFLESEVKNLPNCQILHCSGTDPDFYLRNLANVKYQILSVTTIGYFLERKEESVIKLINLADVIFLNSGEFEILKTKINLKDKLFVITKGKNGVDIYLQNQKINFETETIKTINTVNAGDVFAGSFLANLIETKTKITNLKPEEIELIIKNAQGEVKKLLEQNSYYRINL